MIISFSKSLNHNLAVSNYIHSLSRWLTLKLATID